MIELKEQTFGLRDKQGRFLRVSTRHEGEGEEFIEIDQYGDQIYRADNFFDPYYVANSEIPSWNGTKSRPANYSIQQSLGQFEIVCFKTSKLYDVEGGDPVIIHETVGKPDIRYVSGVDDGNSLIDKKDVLSMFTFSPEFDLNKELYNDDDPICEAVFLRSAVRPTPGMYLITKENNRLEILDVQETRSKGGEVIYALLINHANKPYHEIICTPFIEIDDLNTAPGMTR